MRESQQRPDLDIDLLHLTLERRIEEIVEDSKSRIVHQKTDVGSPSLNFAN